MNDVSANTPLQSGNRALNDRRFADALALYRRAIAVFPELEKSLAVNIKLAQAGLREEQWLQEKVPQALVLAPVNQLLPDPQGAGVWRATGNDPWFEVSQASGQPMSEGWFLLTLVMDTDAAKKIAKFYMDYGDGHTEHHAANLRFQSKLACTRVLHFRGVVKSLRFDPLEEPGIFRLQELTCQRVDEAQALQEMLECRSRARGCTPAVLGHGKVLRRAINGGLRGMHGGRAAAKQLRPVDRND